MSPRLEKDWDLDAITGCWNWLGYIDSKGYGKLQRDGEQQAHRWYYKRHVGPIPEGLQIDHLCFNKACVNPEHLEVVTARVNIHRRPANKMDWEKVGAIRASAEPATVLAERYGVGFDTICDVRSYRTWGIPGVEPINRARRFTDEEYQRIYERWLAGESQSAIARDLETSSSCIWKIVRRMQRAAA